jgi:hypothetical protein
MGANRRDYHEDEITSQEGRAQEDGYHGQDGQGPLLVLGEVHIGAFRHWPAVVS